VSPLAGTVDVVVATALLALVLVLTAYRHPSARVEALVAGLAVLVTVSFAVPTGLVETSVLPDGTLRLARWPPS